MKKILALVMAMALLVCSAAVFTVSAAEVTFDEIVAAEKEYNKPNASNLVATHADRIVYSDTEDGFSVSVRTASPALIGFSPKNKFVLDGAHIVLGAFSDWNAETKNYRPVINIGTSGPLASWGADSSVLIINLAEGYIWSHQDTGNGGDGWTMVLNNATVVKAMTQYETGVSFEVDVNGEVYITLTNAAGTATGALQNYGKNWTDHTEAYITFGGWYDAEITFNYPLRAFHSGNVACGVDVAKTYTNTVEYDSAIYGTSLDMWIGNEGGNPGDYWYAGGASNTLKPGEYTGSGFEKSVNTDGSVHLYVGAHSSARFFYTANKSYAIDGAHMVLGQIKSSSGRFGLQITNGEGGRGTTWLVFKSNGELYNMYNGWGGEQPVGADAAVVGAMFAEDAKTVLSFAKLGTGFDLTIQNAAGTVTFYVQNGLNPAIDWTAGTSKVNFAICDWNSTTHDTDMQVDVYAIHGGEDECGLSLQQKIEAGNEMNADLAAATSGATVKLTANATADSVVVKPGVTLDLNGYTLEADYAASFGDVVNGTLKVAKDNIMLSEDNAALPVWNGSAYVFVAAPTFQDQSVTNGSNVKYTFLPTFDADVHDLLAAGAAASDVPVTVRLTWTAKEGGKATQRFVYSDEFVQTVVNSYNGEKYNSAFTLLFNNAANLSGLTYEVEVVSGTGAVFAPSKTVA